MPGFLSNYQEIRTIYFDDAKEYWAKVRRFPQRADFKAAQAKLISPTMRYVGGEEDQDGKATEVKAETSGAVDTGAYQDELVARALVDWNLTDEEGVLIPLGTVDRDKGPDPTRYRAVGMLPETPFEQILNSIEGAGKKKKPEEEAKEEAAFRRPGPRSLVSGEGEAKAVTA